MRAQSGKLIVSIPGYSGNPAFRRPSSYLAVGGPKIEFSSAILVKIFGFSRLPMSMKEIVSFPGGNWTG